MNGIQNKQKLKENILEREREREYSKNDEKCSQWYDDTLPSTESLHRMI